MRKVSFYMIGIIISAVVFSMVCGTGVLTISASEDNFAEKAQEYFEYIGTNLADRSHEYYTFADLGISFMNGVYTEEGEAVIEDAVVINNTHDETVEWIISELKNAGYTDDMIHAEKTVDYIFWLGSDIEIQNVELVVEGQDTTKQIIVGAHYDGEGAGDNGSGVALLLATAVGLYGRKPLYTVKYVFFDGEELGLLGSERYAAGMNMDELISTVYMVNIDAIAFGDYCNIYGGYEDGDTGIVSRTEAYDLAMEKADMLGINTVKTEELDGYFEKYGEGPAVEKNTVYTNPWTKEHPAPVNQCAISPTTIDASDHAAFKNAGIPYVYFEAANWFAEGDGGEKAYKGYYETIDTSLGEYGMFMNTEYDTLENLNQLFPGRALEHFNIYSPILSSLIMYPASAE